MKTIKWIQKLLDYTCKKNDYVVKREWNAITLRSWEVLRFKD